MGFIKFDLLGLSTLEMIQSAIGHLLKRHYGVESPTYKDIKAWYNENIHPDKIDLNDSQVYTNIFHKGKFVGIFQFTNEGAQNFCKRAKPENIIDISAITSIYRPGPLSAKVDRLYIKAKNAPENIQYTNSIVKGITEETAGFLIFQEQIALLAHELGKDISLDEANKLRKLLTKKGTGKGDKEKKVIHDKFIDGCCEKGMLASKAEELWQTFEYFSGYGFNKSHAVSYSILSYQCAWLLNYFPECWMAAFLDKEPESRKEAAISLAQKYGFYIENININTSTQQWEIGDSALSPMVGNGGMTLIQPFSSIKGLGEKAVEQIINNRPFETAEDLLFSENIIYSKLNKRSLDVLCRSGALDPLVDERFTGCKHFWMACIQDRPKNTKKLNENINLYAPEEDFTREEKIDFISSLTGIFPFDLVLTKQIKDAIDRHCVPPIGKWDNDLGVAWFIPREIIPKKTKNGKLYWIVRVVDNASSTASIKCWGVKENDQIHINRPYAAKLSYDEQWGFSTRSIRHTFKLLG
jgi:DNA polymerase-3 subunit alpha